MKSSQLQFVLEIFATSKRFIYIFNVLNSVVIIPNFFSVKLYISFSIKKFRYEESPLYIFLFLHSSFPRWWW